MNWASYWIAALLLCALAGVSAFLSGMETALFSISDFRLRRWRERDPVTAAKFEKLMSNPRSVLSVILLTDTMVNTLLLVFCLAFANAVKLPIPNWCETLGLFGLIVLICDLFPKMLALSDPYRLSKTALGILQILLPVVDPLAQKLQVWAERVAESFSRGEPDTVFGGDDEELITLVTVSAERGDLSDDEREMIQEIIKLGNKTVKDCMTPRVDAFTIPDTMDNEVVIRELRIKRHGRVPVYGDSPDEILGILDVKTFLLNPKEHYTENLEPPSFVPETMRVVDLLRSFLTRPQRMAIVVDEFGGTEGIITFNDIVEEILGDAAPRRDEGLYIEEIGDEKWLASGSARLDDLDEALGVDVEEEGIDTIGGLIFNKLGYLPKPGTVVEIPPLRLEILQSSRKRVLEVTVERMDPKEKAS